MNVLKIDPSLLTQRFKYEIIPMGMNCTISHYMRSKGIRTVALPFDWNVTPIQSSIKLIKNNFSDFLLTENLIFLPPVFRLLFDEHGATLEMKNEIITPVICKEYAILFPHDYPEDYEGSIASVRKKYKRRIYRLTKLLNSNKHLIFVHHDEAINEWQQNQYSSSSCVSFKNDHRNWKINLSNALDDHFPKLKYTLIELRSLAQIIETAEQ